MRKPVLPYPNNKGADQPAHPCSLISTFVVRHLDSTRIAFKKIVTARNELPRVKNESVLCFLSLLSLTTSLLYVLCIS